MSKKSKKYLNSEDLKEEILKCKDSKIASEKLGRMFQILVENVSRSFYWENPADGDDCKANALFDLCNNFWKYEPENGNAFSFCSQICFFGIAGAHRILHPKKYEGTISLTCLDSNGKNFDMYNI
jgi:hypothetical protein